MFSIDAPMPESDVAELVELPATARGVEDAVQLGWFSLHSLHPAKDLRWIKRRWCYRTGFARDRANMCTQSSGEAWYVQGQWSVRMPALARAWHSIIT